MPLWYTYARKLLDNCDNNDAKDEACTMECRDYQQEIVPYINGELNIKAAEEFVTHVKNCRDCYDELEIYYTIYRGLKLLDEDVEISDIRESLQKSLLEDENRMRRIHQFTWYKYIIWILAMIVLLGVTAMQFGIWMG